MGRPGTRRPKETLFRIGQIAGYDASAVSKTAGDLRKQDRKITTGAQSPFEGLHRRLGALRLAALVGNLREHTIADVL